MAVTTEVFGVECVSEDQYYAFRDEPETLATPAGQIERSGSDMLCGKRWMNWPPHAVFGIRIDDAISAVEVMR
jgi:hypothetical protein